MIVVIVLTIVMSVKYAFVFGGRVRVSGNSILKSLELTLSAVLYFVSMYILE